MEIWLIFVSFIPCYIIAGGIHELGHVILGVFQQFRFYLFVVGPFGIKKDEAGKVKLYFEKNVSLWGGVSATLPSDLDSNNFKK